MTEVQELKIQARRVFDSTGLDETHWKVFWVGFLAAIKEYGTE